MAIGVSVCARVVDDEKCYSCGTKECNKFFIVKVEKRPIDLELRLCPSCAKDLKNVLKAALI